MTKTRKKPEPSDAAGWSVTRLSNELRVPRQTVAGRLANVEPIGKRGLANLYALHDAVRAIFGQATVAEQDAHRAAILRCKAEQAEIALADMRAELCRTADVVDLTFTMAREFRDAWLNWPDRAGPALAAELQVDTVKLILALEEAVRQQLTEMATAEQTAERTEGQINAIRVRRRQARVEAVTRDIEKRNTER